MYAWQYALVPSCTWFCPWHSTAILEAIKIAARLAQILLNESQFSSASCGFMDLAAPPTLKRCAPFFYQQTSDHSLCLGYKPDKRWLKSVKISHTPVTGPLVTYKIKPAAGWKVATEASLDKKQLASSITYKTLQGE
jgi:hypothetical protein